MNTALTPYILFVLGQIVIFIIWIVNLQTKINDMKKDLEAMEKAMIVKDENDKEKREEMKEQNAELLNRFIEALGHLSSARTIMEGIQLSKMKTRRA